MPKSTSSKRPSKIDQFLSRLSTFGSNLSLNKNTTKKEPSKSIAGNNVEMNQIKSRSDKSITSDSQANQSQNSRERASRTALGKKINQKSDFDLQPKSLRRMTYCGSNKQLASETDDRPLRNSQAAICLLENEAEVCYASGRKSTLNFESHSGLDVADQIRRMSMVASKDPELLDNSSDDEDSLDQEQNQNNNGVDNTDEIKYTYSYATEYRSSTIGEDQNLAARSSLIRRLSRNSSKIDGRDRSNSIVSNRDRRLSTFNSEASARKNSLNSRNSTLSNKDLINERNNDPEARTRPTSAGTRHTQGTELIKKFLKEEDELNKALSDTEVDTMAIECKYDMVLC